MSADAQFSLARTLRPPPNFATAYQGNAGAIPFPGVLDEQAGRPGYDPNLLGGIPVPLGSRVLIWLPFLLDDSGQPDPLNLGYVYKIVFRLRSPRDFRDPGSSGNRKAYHQPKQAPGVPDTTVLTNQARFLLPACMWVVAYQTLETEFGPATPQVRVYPEGIMPNSAAVGVALSPTNAPTLGVIQQGMLDPAVYPSLATQPAWQPIFIDACGDDMLILMRKAQPSFPNPPRNWDFTLSPDSKLVDFYSSPETGIYVMTGMMP
jgi:hypothetical protein